MSKKKIKAPVLPLNEALLFPHMILPMHIYEKEYIKLIDYSMSAKKNIAVTFKKQGFEMEPSKETICCLGNITYSENAILESDEGKAIIVSGTERAKINNILQTEPYIIAELDPLPDTCSSQTGFNHYKEVLPQKLVQFLFLKNVPDRDIHLANLIVDPGHISDFVAYYFIDDMYLKMQLLETVDVCERCKKVEELLDQSIQLMSNR